MKIIFEGTSGILGVLIPMPEYMDTLEGTEEEKMIHVANKDLPTGTKYEIVEDSEIPTDHTFRDAWEYVASDNERTSEDSSND